MYDKKIEMFVGLSGALEILCGQDFEKEEETRWSAVNFFYSKIFRGFIEEDLLLFDLDS
jgi:hypothetical protein